MSAMGKFGLLNRGMRVVFSFSRGIAIGGGFFGCFGSNRGKK